MRLLLTSNRPRNKAQTTMLTRTALMSPHAAALAAPKSLTAPSFFIGLLCLEAVPTYPTSWGESSLSLDRQNHPAQRLGRYAGLHPTLWPLRSGTYNMYPDSPGGSLCHRYMLCGLESFTSPWLLHATPHTSHTHCHCHHRTWTTGLRG